MGLLHVPASLVVVCPKEPMFVQVTVVPTLTGSMAGVKENSWIETPLGFGPPPGAVELPQAAATVKPAAVMKWTNRIHPPLLHVIPRLRAP